jgi:hypothetical protein
LELRSLYASAQLHEVLCLCPPCWSPLTLLGPVFTKVDASVTGITTLEQKHMHSLKLTLSPGTRESSRGREGGAHSPRPHARERGSSAREL